MSLPPIAAEETRSDPSGTAAEVEARRSETKFMAATCELMKPSLVCSFNLPSKFSSCFISTKPVRTVVSDNALSRIARYRMPTFREEQPFNRLHLLDPRLLHLPPIDAVRCRWLKSSGRRINTICETVDASGPAGMSPTWTSGEASS